MSAAAQLLLGLAVGLATLFTLPGVVRADEGSVTAIDIALEPDSTMIEYAVAANARLLGVFPAGFALDETHHPHVTLVQQFVLTSDLDDVYAAANQVLATVKPTEWKLKAFKYYYIPDGKFGLGGIVVEPTAELESLQRKMLEAIAPFTAKTGTPAAFFSTEDGKDIQKPLIEYVENFATVAAGAKFNPHVTIGVGPSSYLDQMIQKPFQSFTFFPVGASVYQLGAYGTARKELVELHVGP